MSFVGLRDFAAARIEVPSLKESVEFYENYVGLEVAVRDGEHAQLRAGLAHHAIELVEDPSINEARVLGFAFTVESAQVVEEARERIKAAGYEIHGLSESLVPYCSGGFGVDDCKGIRWELIYDFHQFVDPPFRAFTPLRVIHPFIKTDRYEETLEFAVNILGFRVSDYVADSVAFLRTENRYHHSLAVMRAPAFKVDHVSFLVDSFDSLMRARAKVQYHDVDISLDLVKHSGSTTIAFYMFDRRHGPQIELAFGHRILTPEEHEADRPRRLAAGARTELDLWRESDDDWRGVQERE